MSINKIIYFLSSLIISFALSSCLGSEEEITPSTKTLLTSCSFGSDIKAYTSNIVKDSKGNLVEIKDTTTYSSSSYPFIIDQLNNIVYTKDSLPAGSDISKMPITITSAGAYATRLVKDNNGNEVDTIWTSTDSLNLNNPVRIKIYAGDEITSRIYTIKVNVHKVDPDSLVWNKISSSFSGGKVTGFQRSIVLGNNIITYTKDNDGTKAYVTDFTTMQSSPTENIINLGSEPNIESVHTFRGLAYMATTDGKIFSSNDGISWTELNWNEKVKTIVGNITINSDKSLMIIIAEENGEKVFKALDSDGNLDVTTAKVPEDFPADNFCGFENRLSTSSKYRLNVMGRENDTYAENDTTSFAWFTNDGFKWTKMKGASVYNLPKLTIPTYLYYNNRTIAFGSGPKEKFNNMFSSVEYGLVWYPNTSKVMLPYDFEGREYYSAVVTPDNYIWIFWSQTGSVSDEVWRGRINELGFAKNSPQI